MTHDEWVLKKVEDTGTRYEHYSDLISVWEEGAEIIRKKTYPGDGDKVRLQRIEQALELLHRTLDGMTAYHDHQISLRRLVDQIPTAADAIEGGRGSPLTERKLDEHEEMT